MPKDRTDAERALHKLGQLVRQGFAKKYPSSEKNLETFRETAREEWEKEQEAERGKKVEPGDAKSPRREPPEPDQER
jgi:hypothetical protein